MKIRASEMEKMFGLSPNGVRLYEKYGIIRPERTGAGSYRAYSLDDMQMMGFGVQLRRYGYSMAEAADMLGGMSEAQQIEAYRRRSDAIEREIENLMRIRKSLRTQISRAERAAQLLDRCEVEEKPAMYFLGSMRDEQMLGGEASETVGDWIERYAPHLSSGLLFDGPFFVKSGCGRPLGGVLVDADVALNMGLKLSRGMTYLPPRRCLVTAFRMDNRAGFEQMAERVRAHAEEHGLALHSGGVARVAQCVREGDRVVATLLLWAPLADGYEHAGEMV